MELETSFSGFRALACFLIWVELCLPKRNVEVLTLVSKNVTLFGKTSQAKTRSYWTRVGPNQIISVLNKKRPRWKGKPSEGRDWDWSDASTSQGMPRIGGSPQTLEKSIELRAQMEPTLPTPWFSTRSFHNCEKISFCCNSPDLW
jgi:hypothetical protein